MANATIKITQLPSGNIATNTILPVVDIATTAITGKVSVGNVANYILYEAGNLLPPAFASELSYSVTNAAQPNITSLGTLTSLSVSDIANITIPGGQNGYVLQTNGEGVLSWVAQGGAGNGSPGGANTQIQFNDEGSFGGSTFFTYNKDTETLATPNILTTSANIYGNITASNASVTTNLFAETAEVNNFTANNFTSTGNITADYFIGNGSALSGITATASGAGPNNAIQFNDNGVFSGNANLTWDNDTNTLYAPNIVSNIVGSTGNLNVNGWNLTNGGRMVWPSVLGTSFYIDTNGAGEFEIASLSNVVISSDITNTNSHFTFATDGQIYCPANANFQGTRVNIGPGAPMLGLVNPTLVVAAAGQAYVQTVLFNSTSTGSADYVAYGADGNDTQAWADMGFAGANFNDPNYTITGPGDGYLFVQSYNTGTGGNLVISTGDQGTVKDIVFSTGGFLIANEFARFKHTTGYLEFTRTGSGIKYTDNTVQTTAWTGTVPLANVTGTANIVEWTSAPVSNTAPGVSGQAAYDAGGNLFVCVAANTWAKFSGTLSW